MCIGIPMQIIESRFGYARCEGMGMQREVETLLVGEQPPGTWLLIFLDSAREVLSEQDAHRITDAVKAVNLVMQHEGGISETALPDNSIEALFADLIDREIPKPDSLIALEQSHHQQNLSLRAQRGNLNTDNETKDCLVANAPRNDTTRG